MPFFPLRVEHADGCNLWDSSGRRFLDCFGMAGTALTGYRHERVVAALRGALEEDFQLLTPLVPGRAAQELAERVVRLVGGHGDHSVWLGSSGAAAVDMLVRLAPAATGRPRLVSYEGGHHGLTLGAAAASADAAQRHRPPSSGIPKAPYPDPYRCPWGPCDESECSLRCLAFLNEHVLGIVSPHEQTAAILIEPIQSASGEIVPPDNYLPALRALCDREGIALLVDEVKTGLGRTGKMFAYEHSGIAPDAVVLGKGLGGGLPLAAVVGRIDLLDQEVPAAETLGGAPLPCHAALATLDIIEEQDLAGNARDRGRELLDGLRTITRSHPLVGHVRGKGLMIGVELVSDRSARTPSAVDARRLGALCYEQGLLVKLGGLRGNVVGLTPPLTLSSEESRRALEVLERCLGDLAAGRVDDERVAAVWTLPPE
jgi:4-aminobutyrate aminotransferase